MKIIKLIVIASLITLSGCQATSPDTSIHYESTENLQITNMLGCIELSEVSSSYTPADLFHGVGECLVQQQYEKAADLYLVAMSFGFFDTRRVADHSAHQGIMALRMETFNDHDEQTLNGLLTQIIRKNADNGEICSQIDAVGKPSYYPAYMIQHGVGVFTEQENSNGLIDDFDADTAWKEAITVVVNCPS